MPASGDPFEVFEVPSMDNFLDIKHHDLSIQTWALEKNLGHVPDLLRFNMNWSYRCLFECRVGNSEGRVFLYKCTEKTDKWPRNKYLPHARAYGDAFVFMLNRFTLRDKEGRANYGNMMDFAESAQQGGKGRALLKDMLVNW